MLWSFFFSLCNSKELNFTSSSFFFNSHASYKVGDEFNIDCEGQIWSRFKVVMSHPSMWPLWKCNIWRNKCVKLNDKLKSLPLFEVAIFIFKSLCNYRSYITYVSIFYEEYASKIQNKIDGSSHLCFMSIFTQVP